MVPGVVRGLALAGRASERADLRQRWIPAWGGRVYLTRPGPLLCDLRSRRAGALDVILVPHARTAPMGHLARSRQCHRVKVRPGRKPQRTDDAEPAQSL